MATAAIEHSSLADRMLRALRAYAEDPSSPLYEVSILVLKRRDELVTDGWDSETALQKAMREHQVSDDTAGA